MFLAPPSVYEDQVVDMKDVYAECEKKHGKPIDLAVKSTYNPKNEEIFRLLRQLRSRSRQLPHRICGARSG